MDNKARILVFGFSDAELTSIDQRLSEIGVPPPMRLEERHGSVVIGDILREGAIGAQEFDCRERLVLFSNLSEAGVRSLMQVFKSLVAPKPIFAISALHTHFRPLVSSRCPPLRRYSFVGSAGQRQPIAPSSLRYA